MDHEVDKVLCLIKRGPLRVYDDLMEVCIYYIASMFLEPEEQLEEIFHHKLVNEPVKQGII